MHRTRILIVLLLGLLLAAAAAPAAMAQDNLRGDPQNEGEPTDLEGVYLLISEEMLDDNNVDTTGPEDEDDFDSWFQHLLQILRDLGLLPTGTE